MMPEDFYKRMENSKIIPSTSQATIPSMKKVFEGLLEQGYDVLGIFLSSKFSGTVNQPFKRVQCCKKGRKRLLSRLAFYYHGIRLASLDSRAVAEAGESLSVCQQLAEQARDQTGVMFVVETLEYLHRGGRIGGV